MKQITFFPPQIPLTQGCIKETAVMWYEWPIQLATRGPHEVHTHPQRGPVCGVLRETECITMGN